MKDCSKCKASKKEDEFYKVRDSWCIKCSKEWRNTIGRNRQLKRRYGISIEEYNQLFDLQEGKCRICKTHQSKLSKALAVDHCHTSLKVRGLLCFNCNSGLGRFKDNEKLLLEAIVYLKAQDNL